MKYKYQKEQKYYQNNPKQLLIDVAKDNDEKGSSTVTIVILDPTNHTLNTCQFGDSAYMILRNTNGNQQYSCVYQSEEQQYQFNMPYQLQDGHEEQAELAVESRHRLENGDIVIVGSDGLFDNLSKYDIE